MKFSVPSITKLKMKIFKLFTIASLATAYTPSCIRLRDTIRRKRLNKSYEVNQMIKTYKCDCLNQCQKPKVINFPRPNSRPTRPRYGFRY